MEIFQWASDFLPGLKSVYPMQNDFKRFHFELKHFFRVIHAGIVSGLYVNVR